jgi:hypothetical protein
MKKLLAICVLALFATTIAFAQNGTASSKATAAINTSVYCRQTVGHLTISLLLTFAGRQV